VRAEIVTINVFGDALHEMERFWGIIVVGGE